MRYIDMENWPRKKHFAVFNAFDYPHFGLCANVELTKFHGYAKKNDISISIALTYALARAANEIVEFRYRIRDGKVVEHEEVHPSVTVLTEGDLFSYCTIEYSAEFPVFAGRAKRQIDRVKANPTLDDKPGQDELLYMTSLPWISFTGTRHPINLNPVDSVPRLAWGKFFEESGALKMPIDVQAHHALMDGVHVGKFYRNVQEFLDNPADTLA